MFLLPLISILFILATLSNAQFWPEVDEAILGPVVDSDLLNLVLDDPDFLSQVRILEAGLDNSTKLEYKNGHIPNAIYFDAAQISNQSDQIIYDIPQPEIFENYVSSLGISNDNDILIYDRTKYGMKASARAWFLFKLFGHDFVSILDGGFRDFLSMGYNITEKISEKPKRKFKVFYRPELAKSFEEMVGVVKAKNMTILDAREKSEFDQGQIPTAINVPYSSLFESDTDLLKSDIELWDMIKQKNIDLSEPIVTYCLKSPRASALMFVLDCLGAEQVSLYVGSWNEWSKRINQTDLV
ncbi:thiosulfate [Brachionus plicatilis]|uniref:Thiosulfate n=1 Tax=Brachionus plicatilis TaxID=10195 RepID=A0A3M7QAF6_BRAPC|nr:thiosulfate [Brachionus plicatilis]